MKKIAIIGTQGVPAKYGGFETLVENIIGENASPGISYTVFCSSKDYTDRLDSYKGAILRYVPFHANGAQSTLYDIVSLCKAWRGYDTVVILGVSGCLFLPIFRCLFRRKLVINIDGLEHRREKWGRFAKWFLKTSERMAVRYADVVIADNKGIQDYVRETYHKDSELIAYGGDHVWRDMSEKSQQEILQDYGLRPREYAFTVCRIEPENNCHVTLEAFEAAGKCLIFVGNWNRSDYGRMLKSKYAASEHVRLLDPIYDLDILFALRKNSALYVHGHSAGGTNPSLVEAMHFAVPIVAFDVVYNRETTEGKAFYFSDSKDLVRFLREDVASDCGETMREIAERRYSWSIIARQYERLYE